MTVIACLEAVALVAVVFLMLRHSEERSSELLAAHAADEQAWTDERRELLNRIQRPEYLPAGPVPNFVWPVDDEPDEIDLVGTIAEPKDES